RWRLRQPDPGLCAGLIGAPPGRADRAHGSGRHRPGAGRRVAREPPVGVHRLTGPERRPSLAPLRACCRRGNKVTQDQGPSQTERRSSPRIKCQLTLEYRVLTKSQHDMLRPLYLTVPTRMRESSSLTSFAQPTEQSTPSPDQTVIQLLFALHETMDSLIGFLTHERLSSQSLDSSPLERASCVELSESGLRMTGYRRASAGDFV